MRDADPAEVDRGGVETADDEAETDELPSWDDEYLRTVGERLRYNFDLERDYRVRGETFPLYGRMELYSEKHFLHPALSFAHHESREHLFARRVDRVAVDDLERLVDLGHDLADEWIEPDEEHFSTEFTFVTIAPEVPEDVRAYVADLDERTLLKYGYHGHYEVNLVAVAPESRELVASDEADVEAAFRTWDEIERDEPGLLDLIARRLQL